MPIYEYTCQDCHSKFERIRNMKDADAALTCEQCQGDKVTRLISRFNANSGGRVITSSSSGCSSCAGGSCSSCRSN